VTNLADLRRPEPPSTYDTTPGWGVVHESWIGHGDPEGYLRLYWSRPFSSILSVAAMAEGALVRLISTDSSGMNVQLLGDHGEGLGCVAMRIEAVVCGV
jgi:hypothetical protein